MKLKDQVAVITGAGRGIGQATAELFAKEGAKIAIISRTESQLVEVAKKIESQFGADRVFARAGDASDEQTIQNFVRDAEAKLGPLDCLVNNAAIGPTYDLSEMTLDQWRELSRINVDGPFLWSREACSSFKKSKKRGSIVNISSIAGVRGIQKFPGLGAYSTSKAALIALSDSWAVEARALGVRVNCIAPGAVTTDMLKSAAPDVRTPTQPSDVAQTVLYLCDWNQSERVTGALVEIFSEVSFQ